MEVREGDCGRGRDQGKAKRRRRRRRMGRSNGPRRVELCGV